MACCEEGNRTIRTRNSLWAISFFRDTRKSSQQNVLEKIVVENEITDTLEYDRKITFWDLVTSKERRFKHFGIIGILLAFSISLTSVYIMLMTNWYAEQILKHLILQNNTIMFDYWKEPPVKPLISVYVFNYTNSEEALSGREKPKVVEVGPYTFRETMERVNIRFYANGTVSYQEKRSHEFIKEMSSASLQEMIVTPNLALITAVAFSKSSYIITRYGLTFVMKSFDIKPFHKVTVDQFIWGADDDFTTVATKVAELLDREVPSRFGVLSSRVGVSPDVITIFNGETGFEKFGIISRYNGQDKMKFWKSECNRLDAGDGTLYPPRSIRSSDQVYVYAKEFCRRMPLKFDKHIKTEDGFPALRYINPTDIFSSPVNNPNNSCFCMDDDCAPDGLQNTEPCAYGAPIFISFPHFLRADPKLHSSVSGLTPDESKHLTQIDIHEILGVPIGGVSRIQMNIRVIKPTQFSPLDELDDGIFLPVAWLECKIGNLPENLKKVIFHVTYSLAILEYILIFLSLSSSFIFFHLLIKRQKLCEKNML